MNCDFAQFDGAYVLGSLSATDRRDFEAHLPGCPECSEAVRDLAGLPGLLARVDVGIWDGADRDPAPPPTLLPALLQQERRHRRRQVLASAVGVAAALVLGGFVLQGTGVLGTGSKPEAVRTTQAALAMDQLGQQALRATLSVTPVSWGTRLELHCTYTGYDPHDPTGLATYVLVVHTRDGHAEQVATWRAVAGRTITVSGSTAADRAQIASVEVQTSSRSPVLRTAFAGS